MSVCCGPGVALGVSALWLCSGVRLVLSFFRPPLTGHVSVVHALPCACSSYLPSLHIVHISSHVQRSRARRSAEQGSRLQGLNLRAHRSKTFARTQHAA